MRQFEAIGRGIVFISLLMMLNPSTTVAQDKDPEGWARLDSVVATIDGEPILESDILMEVDFGLLEFSQPDSRFSDYLEAYLNRMLILREVEEVGGFRLTAGQAEGAYQGYLLRYKNLEDYESKLKLWDIGPDEIQQRLNRALLASLYTESRIRFFVNILPSDIEKAYEEDRERWGKATIYEVWETIRSELLQANFKQEKDRWLKTLKDRYDLVRYDVNGE